MAQTPVSGPGSESLRRITEAKTIELDHLEGTLSTKNYSQGEKLLIRLGMRFMVRMCVKNVPLPTNEGETASSPRPSPPMEERE
jgi:hypothetical protein